MQLKSLLKKIALEKNIPPQIVMQHYMLERFIERISLSKYKQNFIIKGGFLISAIVGIEQRATMDLDTTAKGFTLSHSLIKEIVTEVCAINVDDNIRFELLGTSDIREKDSYPGIRIELVANYSPIKTPLTIDITTGDIITPKETECEIPLMLQDRVIRVPSYNLETILAEKLETIFSRNITSTRPRDYYDVFILYTLHSSLFNTHVLRQALDNTAKKRESRQDLKNYQYTLTKIRNSDRLKEMWLSYQRKFSYAAGISFEQTCDAIEELMQSIMPQQSTSSPAQ